MGVHSIPFDDTSWGKGVADAEAASTVEQPALTSGEGSAALVRVQPKPHGWDHPRVWWQSRNDPKGEPLFALEDAAEGGRWGTFEQYRQLAERSLRTALSVLAEDLPGVSQVCVLLSRATWSFSGFVTINDPCSASAGARGSIPQEVVVPPLGEGRLGPAPAAEGPARQRQRASIGAEHGGGGPPPSLCRYEG